jgi:hypothetical protein
MGITQHTTGHQNVHVVRQPADAVGQHGRAGRGRQPLRGQSNVQGACDMGWLPNLYTAYQSRHQPRRHPEPSSRRPGAVPLGRQPGAHGGRDAQCRRGGPGQGPVHPRREPAMLSIRTSTTYAKALSEHLTSWWCRTSRLTETTPAGRRRDPAGCRPLPRRTGHHDQHRAAGADASCRRSSCAGEARARTGMIISDLARRMPVAASVWPEAAPWACWQYDSPAAIMRRDRRPDAQLCRHPATSGLEAARGCSGRARRRASGHPGAAHVRASFQPRARASSTRGRVAAGGGAARRGVPAGADDRARAVPLSHRVALTRRSKGLNEILSGGQVVEIHPLDAISAWDRQTATVTRRELAAWQPGGQGRGGRPHG